MAEYESKINKRGTNYKLSVFKKQSCFFIQETTIINYYYPVFKVVGDTWP